MRSRFRTARDDRERGQIVVLFALFLTVLLTAGSIVMDVGNWFVLKRHLQTQVDAAALAGGPAFTGCPQNPTVATAAIQQQALRYAGDPSRDSTTHNPLMEDTADVHAVLNSTDYWRPGDPVNGGGNDWTAGAPCDTKFLDVKATEEDAPLLWGWLPFYPDPKTRARVEISRIQSTNGLRPLGVPEVDPEQVAVVFVNEDGNPNLADSVRGAAFLTHQDPSPTGLESMSIWSSSQPISPVGINGGENFGVVVVESRSTTPISLTGTLSQICNQNPTQTHCYSGGSLDDGLSFIHAYSTSGNGGVASPIVRGVTLSGGCAEDLSAPYFNLTGDCPIGIAATIDFGTGTNDPTVRASQGGVCARVSAAGDDLDWSGGVWTGSFTPDTESGANEIDLTWSTDNNGNCGGNNGTGGGGTINKVAKPYVSDEASGPVQYITVEHTSGGLANSMGKDSTASLDVTVGLVAPLRDAALSDPPIVLRGWVTPSQSQALDCGSGAGPNGWNGAMQNGCDDAYQIYDEAKHVSACGPPPSGVPAADPLDCIASQNGNFQQNTVTGMFTPCGDHPNRWDGMNIPPPWDERWMPLFILDQLAFKKSGKNTYPIRRFGMFYVTAVSGLNCPGDNPSSVSGTKKEMWGHFISYITPGFGETIPSTTPCSFNDGSLCVSNLVE